MIWQLLERPDIKHLLKELITNRSTYPHIDRFTSVHYINTVSINTLRRQMELRRQTDFSLRRVNYHFLKIKTIKNHPLQNQKFSLAAYFIIKVVNGVQVWINCK